MSASTKWKKAVGILVLLLGAVISISWSTSLERTVPGGVLGFPNIYYGTQCLLHQCDPYNVPQLKSFYEASHVQASADSLPRQQSIIRYVNLPTTFLFVAPLTLFPLWVAQTLWNGLLTAIFVTATFLMWQCSFEHAAGLSTFFAFIVLANCEELFAGGNTAGLVVGLCVLATWCFIKKRFAWLGVVCLAVGLVIKPHDAGLVWLYFLLVGGLARKRALQTAGIAACFAVISVLWITVAAPYWLPEMRANLASTSAPGGINEPGPTSIGVNSADMIIDLQTVFSIVRNEPGFYNAATYLVCGVVFLLWARAILNTQLTGQTAWLALTAVAALSPLVTYHRSYDAKLLLVAIPACAILWARGGALAWSAFLLTGTSILVSGDIPLTAIALTTGHFPVTASGFGGKLIAILCARPVPLLLLVTAIFYLWVFIKYTHDRTL